MSLRFPAPRRAVVKVGSSSLRAPDGGLDVSFVAELVAQLAAVQRQGTEIVVVSSGAVAAGLSPMGLTTRPTDLPTLQAVASVGQGELMHTYQACFRQHELVCGQVLLTPDDVIDRTRYLNARHTFERLLALGAVAVVNENDTVATDVLRFGDNDRLAALVASMLGAELLVLLSDVDGLYAGDPSAVPPPPLLDRVDDLGTLDPGYVVSTSASELGRGGMSSKLDSVRIATFSAAHAVIAHARRPGVVRDVVAGQQVGTWFPPSTRRPESRKLWIAFAHVPRGSVHVDEGAVRALVERGSSLLAAGIVGAHGDFVPGDAVDVVGPGNQVVARGLVSYSHEDVLRLKGRSTEEVVAELGPDYQRAVIHRDSLVVVA